jgi:hypothetical protein
MAFVKEQAAFYKLCAKCGMEAKETYKMTKIPFGDERLGR